MNKLKQGDKVSIQEPVFYGIIIDLREDDLVLVRLENGDEYLYPKS